MRNKRLHGVIIEHFRQHHTNTHIGDLMMMCRCHQEESVLIYSFQQNRGNRKLQMQNSLNIKNLATSIRIENM